MESRDTLFWIWLSEALGCGNRDFKRLISLYENPYEIYHADPSEIERLTGLTDHTKSVLCDKTLEPSIEILTACEKNRISVLTYNDPGYPQLLREIKDPPVLLYYKGILPDFDRRLCVAMVGTRRMSESGMNNAYEVAYELGSAGAVIVSGMAAGIDGVCATAAMASGSRTVAILGCGVDILYPNHHGKLRDAILRNGAVMSEYPPGTKPSSYHFPVRNRIISGMSQATAVMEAGVGSGSLITAGTAVLQGRDVFAVPCDVGNGSADATNELIRDGATLLLSADDIFDKYSYLFSETLHPEKAREKGKRNANADLTLLEKIGVIRRASSKASDGERDPQPEPATDENSRVNSRQTKKTPVRKSSESVPKREAVGARGESGGIVVEQISLFPDGNAGASEPTDFSSALPEKEKSHPTGAVGSAPKKERSRSAGSASTEKEDRKAGKPHFDESLLTPDLISILETMPDDRAIPVDALVNLGIPMGKLLASLTMLELYGLIQKLPGGLYSKL